MDSPESLDDRQVAASLFVRQWFYPVFAKDFSENLLARRQEYVDDVFTFGTSYVDRLTAVPDPWNDGVFDTWWAWTVQKFEYDWA